MNVQRRCAWAVIVLVGLMVAPAPAQSARPALSRVQQQELNIWTEQLADPDTPMRIRRQAANLLLGRPYPQATEALLNFLTADEHRQAKIAIAEAIAADGDGARKEFIEPLMGMLTGGGPEVRAAAGLALLTYRADGVIERMIRVMQDPEQDRAVRLDVMRAVSGVLDKRVVGALVGLLSVEDGDIAAAALETLPKLTKIYGYTPRQWRSWWRRNQRKPLSEMLKEWAEKIAKRSGELEDENAALRARLAEATEKLYEATSADQRDALLRRYMDDPVSEVRAVGVKLLEASLGGRRTVPEPLRARARELLNDDNLLIRSRAAQVVAKLGGENAAAVLVAALEDESAVDVREALLKALAYVRSPEALPAVIGALGSEQGALTAAAAMALEKTVEQQGIEGELRGRAVSTLLSRYAAASGEEPTSASVREALLRAMGAVGGKKFIPVMTEALKDPAAMVRLAAVHGLGKLDSPKTAEALAPLVKDPDRGIRRAAIVALGAVNGARYAATIIERTLRSTEADAGVRQQAREEAARIIDKADADALAGLAERLGKRPELRRWRIRTLRALAEARGKTDGQQAAAVLQELAAALRSAGEHAQAAAQLQRVHEQLSAAESDRAVEVWVAWMEALTAADPVAAAGHMLQQDDEDAFARAYVALREGLEASAKREQWKAVADGAEACITGLAPRLTVEQLAALKKLRAEAKKRLAGTDASTQPAGAHAGASEAGVTPGG
ncbi:MAG: HEAT repeat domain-containing protein [Planctomycetota bacterium]